MLAVHSILANRIYLGSYFVIAHDRIIPVPHIGAGLQHSSCSWWNADTVIVV